MCNINPVIKNIVPINNNVKEQINDMLLSNVAVEDQFVKFAFKMLKLSISFWIFVFWTFINIGGKNNIKLIKNNTKLVFKNLFNFKNLTETNIFKQIKQEVVIGKAMLIYQLLAE